MAGIINRAATKKYILQKCKSIKTGWDCNCVSKEALDDIDAFISYRIDKAVRSHITKGKTFRYF